MVEFQLVGDIAIGSVRPGVIVPVSGTVNVGSVVALIGTIVDVGAIGTLLNAPVVTVQGTVQDLGGTVVVGTILNAPLVLAQGTVTVGGGSVVVSAGTVVINNQLTVATVRATSPVTLAGGLATLVAATMQDLVIDAAWATISGGSIQIYAIGIEPQKAVVTSTITSSSWFGGTIPAGVRVQVPGPLGWFVGAGFNIPAGGTVQGLAVTAQFSSK